MYQTRTISSIINEMKSNSFSIRRKLFQQTLMKYINEIYTAPTEFLRIDRFSEDYRIVLHDFDQACSSEVLRKRPGRLLNDESNHVHRDSIIATAFVLSSTINRNTSCAINRTGEDIANELLYAMGYPKLSASSVVELFYIYALNAGLSLAECHELYGGYLKYSSQIGSIDINIQSKTQSTTYYCSYIKGLNHNRDDFYERVFEISKDLRNGSKMLTDHLVKSFDEQLNNQAISVSGKTGEISNSLKMDALKIRFYLMFASQSPEITDEVTDVVLRTNKIIDMDVLDVFRHRSREGRCFGASMRGISDWLCANGRSCSVIKGKTKAEEVSRRKSRIPYVNKGQREIKTNSGIYTLETWSSAIDKLFPKDDSGVGQRYLAREVFIMWLLYCGKTVEEINLLLGKRFETLNMDVYFDRFAIILASFSCENGKLVYFDRKENKTYAVENDRPNDFFPQTNGLDVQRLRASIAIFLLKHYDPEHRINNFFATEDSISPQFFNFRTRKSDGNRKGS